MAWYSTRNRIRFLLISGAILIGMRVYGLYIHPMWMERSQVERKAPVSPDKNVRRNVEITQPYTLRWSERQDRPALRLVIPVTDFGVWRLAQHPVLAETPEGPLQISLEMPIPGADGLTLEAFGSQCIPADPETAYLLDPGECPMWQGRVVLNRDLGDVQPWALKYLQGDKHSLPHSAETLRTSEWYTPFRFWVRVETGVADQEKLPDVEIWNFLGWDCSGDDAFTQNTAVKVGAAREPLLTRNKCHAPPNWIAQRYPGYFNLRHVYGIDHCRAVRDGRCPVEFLYRGRHIKVYSRMTAHLSVIAALDMLARLARDTASPPQAVQGLVRAERALADCRLASSLMLRYKKTHWLLLRYEAVRKYQCGLAVQLARSVLEKLPDAASRIMLESMVDYEYKAVVQDRNWDRWYADDLFAALMRIGRTESVDGVRAHMLRLRSSGVSAEARDQSYKALLTLAPKVLGNNIRLLPMIESQLDDYIVQKKESSAHLVDFLNATLEHAEREFGTDADSTFTVRYSYCRRRMWEWNPKILNHCADALIAHWSRRTPTLANVQESISPIQLGLDIAFMLNRCATAAGADCNPERNRSRLDVVRHLLAKVPTAAQDEEVRHQFGELPIVTDRGVCDPMVTSCTDDVEEHKDEEAEETEEAEKQDSRGYS